MGIQKQLRAIWACAGIELAVMFLNSDLLFKPNLFTISVLSAVGYLTVIVSACMLFQLRRESSYFFKAFAATIVQLVANLSFLLSYLIPIFKNSWETIFMFFFSALWFVAIISRISSVARLLANFFLFWALDERINTHGYDYPPKRIRWCFYAPFTGMVLNIALFFFPTTFSAAITLLSYGVSLVLFYQYNQAVKAVECEY